MTSFNQITQIHSPKGFCRRRPDTVSSTAGGGNELRIAVVCPFAHQTASKISQGCKILPELRAYLGCGLDGPQVERESEL